jgi:YidC/Oxa1 family membrane protein insertase
VENQRNMILAIVLSAIVLFGWSFLSDRFFPTANPPSTKVVEGKQIALPKPEASPDPVTAIRDRAIVMRETPRIRIATPRVQGSINLKGARIDDLVLPTYRETIDKNSPPIRLLSPAGTKDAYFAGFGWSGEGLILPGPDTIWQASAPVLAPGKPVTLSWENGEGQRFEILLSIDANYMFTVAQKVSNTGTGAIAVRPYSLVSRAGVSKDPDSWTIHTGPMSAVNGVADYDVDYKDVDEAGPEGVRLGSKGGWFGFVDKYWLTAVIPDQSASIDGAFRTSGNQTYQAEFSGRPEIIQPGKAVTQTSRFFAGAKEVATLDAYAKDLGIAQFDRAIDWGWFIWFEKPIFYLLDWLFRMAGNFGVAIILLTCIVRGVMFPIAQRQFASMAAMRAVQPKMKELQERHKDDKTKLQQEMLALYQREKINPLGGCLPIVLQIPIFYALYKVLMLTIEMRHQPFALWIHDLSAPDPLTPLNLFGLLPFTPPAIIAIGVLPILLGITMYLQFKLNPQPMDDIQKQVFGIMPWIFMFIMAPFAAGLQLYWTVSNVLTIAQQKWLYSKHPALQEAQAK